MITPPKTKLENGMEYPGQIPPSKQKRHEFLGDIQMKKIPAVCPPPTRHTPSRFERVLPATPKSGRHPLAQAWRDAKHSAPVSQPILLLASGQPEPLLLLASGISPEAKALEAIAEMRNYPVALFLREFGVPVMNALLNENKVVVIKDKLCIRTSKLTPAPVVEPTPDMTVVAAVIETEAEPRPTVPPKRVAPVAPIFKNLPGNQQYLNPLGNAVTERQMRVNTSTAFSLASQIHDDANAAHKWLRAQFNITPNSMITSDKLAEVQKAVTEEQLKYATPATIAALNAWGLAIYGGSRWYMNCAGDTIRYSGKRTKITARLYQAQADQWLKDLRNIATPEQVLEAGQRQAAIVKGATEFGKRRVH
jgi:hypothetical protein